MNHHPFLFVRATSIIALTLFSFQNPINAEQADSRNMVEVEAHFVKASASQLKKALGKNGNTATGVFSSEQFDQIRKALQAEKADFFSSPRSISMNGQRCEALSVREFPYPAKYDADANRPGKFVPSQFETKTVGTTFIFESLIMTNGRMSINIEAEVTEFLGFIDYTDAKEGKLSADAMSRLMTAPLKEGGIWQPIFSTSSVTTSVDIGTGETLLLGGLSSSLNVDAENAAVIQKSDPARNDQSIYLFVTARAIMGK